MMDLELAGKIILVTGANGGIGSSICKAFLQQGSKVIALYRGEPEKIAFLHEWASDNDCGDNLETFSTDITNASAVEEILQQIMQKYSHVDVLVNNAGNLVERPFLITGDSDWEGLLDVHLKGNIVLTRAVAKQMLMANRGNVINITSVVGSAWGRGVSAYASIKSAINRLTQILAVELGKKGIRVNAVAPGLIDTSMSKVLQARAEDVLAERILLNRLGTPDDVARAVLFLASDVFSSYVTGHILTVDGGVSL